METLDFLLDKSAGRDPRHTPKAERVPEPLPLPHVESDESPGTFELELSDFSFLSVKIRNPPALRFTVTWKFRHPKYGLLGQSEEGWICTRNAAGDLNVSPPIHRFGPMQTKQLKTITAEFHQLVLSMLVNNRTKAGASYGGEVGKQYLEDLKLAKTERFDPELPKEIKA